MIDNETQPGLVRVAFRKQLSDTAYGTEAAEITLEGWATGEEDRTTLAAMLLAEARRMVHDELRNSPSANVRRGVEYPVAANGRSTEMPFR